MILMEGKRRLVTYERTPKLPSMFGQIRHTKMFPDKKKATIGRVV